MGRLLLLLLLVFSPPVAGAKEPRPNILFIFSDDHRHDALGVVNSLVKTPNLDKLSAGSVRFERAYATTAICSPARGAVLSGRYGTRSGVSTLADSLKFPEHTFAHYLRGAGYRTAQFGKWHLGTTPAAAGFEQYARINSNGSWFQRRVDTNIPGLPNKLGGTFFEEFMADAVIEYLADHVETASDKPFVLWWCNQVPHVDGKFRYPDGDGDRSDSVADNTWVVFVGDNGWQTGHHKFTSKVLAYEESARVPLLVKAPGVAPRVERGLVLNIDLTPMFLDIAGVPAAAHHQGLNLGELIRRPDTEWRSHLYYEAVVPEAALGAKPHDSIRDDRFKLIRTYGGKGGRVSFEELYDLQSDPGEMTNLAMEPAHSATKAALTKALEVQRARIASSPDPGAD